MIADKWKRNRGGVSVHQWPLVQLTLTWHTDWEYRLGPVTIEILAYVLLFDVVLLMMVVL